MHLIRYLAAVGFLLFASSAFAEVTVGRWLDAMIPNMPKYNRTMTIVIKDDGSIVLISEAGDGSSSTRELREVSSGIYELVGSRSGDKYRIVPSDGNLQLLDNDGLIRVARRIETKETKKAAEPGATDNPDDAQR